MKPTRELSTEHNAVLVALQILEKVEAAVAARNDQALGHLEQLLDFFKGFVDRCHHGKEEDVLFPMADRLVPDDVAAHLAEQFEEIERDRVGVGKHEAYHAMLHNLKDLYGVA